MKSKQKKTSAPPTEKVVIMPKSLFLVLIRVTDRILKSNETGLKTIETLLL